MEITSMLKSSCFFYFMKLKCSPFVLLFIFSVFFTLLVKSDDDAETLITLKSSIDPRNLLPWRHGGTDMCKWKGVRRCSASGKVTKLVLEHMYLNGTLHDGKTLNRLEQLRVFSLKGNSISGQIPNLSGLHNLKALYLAQNQFYGGFPNSIVTLHRLKIVVLSGNHLSGTIPATLLNLHRLYALELEDNGFAGQMPPLNQSSLRFLNVSSNRLSGKIPSTRVLKRFNLSSFANNPSLCGLQIPTRPCASSNSSRPAPPSSHHVHHGSRTKLIKIIAGGVGGLVFLLLISLILAWFFFRRSGGGARDVGQKAVATSQEEEMEGKEEDGNPSAAAERGASGNLVFCGALDSPSGGRLVSYTMDDLLRASAESLGRGSVGSTYKAVMESGYIVTVKRLKDAAFPRLDEFRLQMGVLGRLAHPNLVPIRAYFHSKEERLLVYDYFPNGSLHSLIHGSRSTLSAGSGGGGGKPLHWTSCLKIAEDLASALAYIHQNPGLTHGNLKSSNVLLGSDFESCLTDYSLGALKNPESHDEPSAASLFYRSPELIPTSSTRTRLSATREADVYGFGIILLELLTGRTPSQDLVVAEGGINIQSWVRSIREEETNSGGDDPSSGNEEEKLGALVSIAVDCVSVAPENRPAMRDILKLIRSSRAEAAQISSSSDHSPGRWSDTIQSMPRMEVLSM